MTVRWLDEVSPVRWLGESSGQLGVTTNAAQWGWRKNCLAACEQACRDETGGVTIPYVNDICKAQCYDDSGCANLPYGSKDEYEHAMAQAEALADQNAYNAAQARTPTTIVSEAYPWKKVAPETKTLQENLNKKLVADGLCLIGTDGKLGPSTCGAAKHYGIAPANCLAFKAPMVCNTSVAQSTPTPTTSTSATPSRGKFWFAAGANTIVALAAYGLTR